MILTASYDNTAALWDLRQLKQPLEEITLEGLVWDVKWTDTQIAFASSYDGYFFAPKGDSLPAETSCFKGHESICYAHEFVQSPEGTQRVVTSSFYDNSVKLIEYNL